MKKVLVALLLLGLVGVSQADIIARYEFDNVATSSDTQANSTAGSWAISSGTWTYGTASATAWTAAGGAVPVSDRGSWGTAASTFASSVYWYFTVTPDANYQFNISSFDFLLGRTGSGPTTFGWSINGTLQEEWTPGITTINSYSSAPDEPSTQYSSAVTIGLHAWGVTSTGNLRVDNVTLNGSVTAIPEPGVLALLGLGLGALFYVRRQRK